MEKNIFLKNNLFRRGQNILFILFIFVIDILLHRFVFIQIKRERKGRISEIFHGHRQQTPVQIILIIIKFKLIKFILIIYLLIIYINNFNSRAFMNPPPAVRGADIPVSEGFFPQRRQLS